MTMIPEDEVDALYELQQLLVQLERTRDQLDDLTRRAGGLRTLIDGLVALFPALEDHLPANVDGDGAERPRGAEAALVALRQLHHENQDWVTVQMVVHRLGALGWLPESEYPANAVRSALERLVERGDVVRSMTQNRAVVYREAEKEPF